MVDDTYGAHSLRCLTCYSSMASSKAGSQENTIYCVLLQIPISAYFFFLTYSSLPFVTRLRQFLRNVWPSHLTLLRFILCHFSTYLLVIFIHFFYMIGPNDLIRPCSAHFLKWLKCFWSNLRPNCLDKLSLVSSLFGNFSLSVGR
jgi:hypothetical protein